MITKYNKTKYEEIKQNYDIKFGQNKATEKSNCSRKSCKNKDPLCSCQNVISSGVPIGLWTESSDVHAEDLVQTYVGPVLTILVFEFIWVLLSCFWGPCFPGVLHLLCLPNSFCLLLSLPNFFFLLFCRITWGLSRKI